MRWLKQWWPALVWAGVIWSFSTGVFTSENTASIIIPFLHWLLPHATSHTLRFIHHLIRKSGHFTEYFIFSLLLLRSIRSGRRGTHLTWALATIALVACWATIDEFHQSFVPGRTAAVSDVLLDTTGGIAAQIVVGLVTLWRGARAKRQNKASQSGTVETADND
jgi:VanZ family protein